jgi:hypothetical protein
MTYQRGPVLFASLTVVFASLVFPTDAAAGLVRYIGLPGRAYEWILFAALCVAVASVLMQGGRIANGTIAALSCAVVLWGLVLNWSSVMRATAPPVMIIAGMIPYFFWLSLLVIGLAGSVPSWRQLVGVMAAATVTTAAVGAFALLFSPPLLAFLLQRSADNLAAYYELSFRLPIGSGYLLPFLMLACVRTMEHAARGTTKAIAGLGLILFTSVLVANQSRTLLGITVLAFAWIALPDLVRNPRISKSLLPAGIGAAAALALIIGNMDPALRKLVAARFGTLFMNPSGFVADVYTGNRDYLYQYSGQSLMEHPILGRGLGTIIPRPGGGYAAMQDVTILNHIDKSGLIGLSLFIVFMIYVYWRMRRALALTRGRFAAPLEYELRRLFVQYFPFILLTCLNVDMLYEDSFVLLFGIAAGSLMAESAMQPAKPLETVVV